MSRLDKIRLYGHKKWSSKKNKSNRLDYKLIKNKVVIWIIIIIVIWIIIIIIWIIIKIIVIYIIIIVIWIIIRFLSNKRMS